MLVVTSYIELLDFQSSGDFPGFLPMMLQYSAELIHQLLLKNLSWAAWAWRHRGVGGQGRHFFGASAAICCAVSLRGVWQSRC